MQPDPHFPGKLSKSAQAALTLRGMMNADGVRNFAPAIGAALVVGDDTVVVVEGVRRLGHPAEVQRDDRFQLGSITKPLTGLMVGCVVHDTQLSYSTTLSQTYPEFFDLRGDLIGDVHSMAYRDVPLGDYMSHTSGIVEDPPLDTNAAYMTIDPQGPDKIAAKRRLFCRLATQDPRFGGAMPPPKHLYGPGHVIASSMAEQETGKPWEDLMKDRLFGPLGITNVSMREKTELFMHKKGANGKVDSFRVERFEKDSPQRHFVLGPTGTVAMSMPEAAKLLRAIAGRDAGLMGAASWDACLTPQPGHTFTRAGWSTTPGHGIIEHNGSYDNAYYAFMRVDPANGIGAIAATNSGLPGAEKLVDDLRDKMFALAANW